jgi:predicted acyl esterase
MSSDVTRPTDDVLIETRKGSQHCRLLVRPTGPQKPLPALLEYTTYLTPGFAREAAAHGYVGVIAYARGRGQEYRRNRLPYQHDGDDVRAVINWIAKQDWSDGRVGMYGRPTAALPGGRLPSTSRLR